MKKLFSIISFVWMISSLSSCNNSAANKKTNTDQSNTNAELADFINQIKAVDNHAHPNTIEPDDKGYDALPLDELGNIELPARVRPESHTWLDAAKALYGFTGAELNDKSMKELMDAEQTIIKEKGE
ncbi:MAG TPA: hypothetical protein VET23_06620, partial [Chitinophagaceae bacterium]|nr:hypothetical protein [Chitinophagaceae bacterium]